MIHSIALLTFGAATAYLVRRDLTAFNHERRAGLWRVDGRRSLLEAYQDWQTRRALRRDVRAAWKAKRAETVAQLGVKS